MLLLLLLLLLLWRWRVLLSHMVRHHRRPIGRRHHRRSPVMCWHHRRRHTNSRSGSASTKNCRWPHGERRRRHHDRARSVHHRGAESSVGLVSKAGRHARVGSITNRAVRRSCCSCCRRLVRATKEVAEVAIVRAVGRCCSRCCRRSRRHDGRAHDGHRSSGERLRYRSLLSTKENERVRS